MLAQTQKSVIISPKRKHRRKPLPSPVASPSPAPEDSEPESLSSLSSEASDHPTEASPTKKNTALEEAARRRRTRNKAGRPRVTKTYKVNKTIRGVKGKVIPKSITSKNAVSTLKKKTYEKVLTASTTTTTTAKAKTPSLPSSSSSVTSRSSSTVVTRATRRSMGAVTAVDDEVSNQLLEQAITTVLSAATGIDGLPAEGPIVTAPVLNAVQVAG